MQSQQQPQDEAEAAMHMTRASKYRGEGCALGWVAKKSFCQAGKQDLGP